MRACELGLRLVETPQASGLDRIDKPSDLTIHEDGMWTLTVNGGQSEIPTVEQNGFCFSARRLEHEVRPVPAKRIRCPVNQRLLAPSGTQVDVFVAVFPALGSRSRHSQTSIVRTNAIHHYAHDVNTSFLSDLDCWSHQKL